MNKIQLAELSLDYPDIEIEFEDHGFDYVTGKYKSVFRISDKTVESYSSAITAEDRLKDDKKIINKTLEELTCPA